MNTHDLLIQRYLDGELGEAQAAAVDHLLHDDPAAADLLRRLRALGGALQRRAERFQHTAQPLLTAISERLPSILPVRSHHLSLVQLAIAGSAIPMAILLFGLKGSYKDMVNLTALAGLSILCGALLIAGAQSLSGVPRGWLGSMLRYRLSIGRHDRLLYRATGLVIVAGGIYLLL